MVEIDTGGAIDVGDTATVANVGLGACVGVKVDAAIGKTVLVVLTESDLA